MLQELSNDLPWAEHESHAAETRGRLASPTALLAFVLAGNATLTVVSRRTSTRFTYRFTRPDPEPGRARPVWVALMDGPDNESNYRFLGTVWPGVNGFTYNHGRKSTVGEDAPSVVALRWMVKLLNLDPELLLEQAEFWHEGRCGRCGRKLTVPASIESGFGPECIQRIGT